MMKWFAHRGASDRFPENTLEAIEAAIPYVDGIEFDVHFSRDGVGVIIHDETVNRTTDGTGRVVDLTLAELKRLNAGARFKGNGGPMQTTIPTLDEVLELLAPTDLLLNIELKTDTIRYPGIEAYTLERCRAHGIAGERLILSSFNHYSIATVRELDPSIETAILYPYPLYHPEQQAILLGAKAIHPDYRRVTREDVVLAHQAGIEVRVYTPKTAADVRRMIELGIDAVIVNDPQAFQKSLSIP
ncbi:glycerophosphoryl diester phosphodiesterase [Exiguobacterium sibiricum 255-15]|uniref:Glycerophosphoryl diester phosphodiesterase n=1 Tax=Exiguobacterium sibiricum (strain DSM 17290 / CCUG 55495 / CIP 109462 / JCM 13490 / 255-15) TaxID=262543 RepID=B1YH29_EXIS2|nr:glycerophosphodiester phosphodiesterase [Exiguobacterium sibiricum]ACB61090.1 glycerophosphoryl diester phosphodiesterase [Exiguobacterium sibiricum 255-15]